MLGVIEEFFSGELRYMPLVFLVSTLLATPVAGLILWLSTRWRQRRLAAGLWDDSPEAVIESGLHGTKRTHQLADQFSWHHLKSWHLMALAGLTVASAASLWLGWHVVVWALAAAALVSYLWHFKLRRSGIRWSGAYSLSSWTLPYLVVVGTIVLFSAPPELSGRSSSGLDGMTLGFHWWRNRVEWPYAFLYPELRDLDTWWLTGTALWAFIASTVSLGLTRYRNLTVNPAMVVSASCPVALWFWFVTPWGILLGAFTMVLFGHAMSRERRLRVMTMLVPGGECQDVFTLRRSNARSIPKRILPFAVMVSIAMLALVPLTFEQSIDNWLWREVRDYEWHWAWFDLIRTALIWVPLITFATVGYVVLRKISPPLRAAPYVATAILAGVMLDALIQGAPYISELTWSDLTLSSDPYKYISVGIDSFTYFGPRLLLGDLNGAPLGLSLVVAAGLLSGIVWQVARDTLADDGGLLYGIASIVVAFWVTELAARGVVVYGYTGTWYVRLDDFLLANLVIAAMAMFATLYWCFGPGSIRAFSRQPRR